MVVVVVVVAVIIDVGDIVDDCHIVPESYGVCFLFQIPMARITMSRGRYIITSPLL